MISKDLAQKVKELELHTRRILSGSGVGSTRSLQKGFGFDFDQLRSYQHGDDVRLIDWKSSARSSGNLYVRQYFEERNRTFMICLDISSSTHFGSGIETKQEMMQQIAGVLALAAAWSKDQVGLILFSDQVEYMIPPSKGQLHVHRIVEQIFAYKAQGTKTDINVLCDYVVTHVSKKATLLVVSDFIAPDFSKSLKKILSNINFVAITCLDSLEIALQNVGMVWMQDPETQKIALVNTNGGAQGVISQTLRNRLKDQKASLAKVGVETLVLRNQKTFMHDLVSFFQKRMIY